MTQTAIVTKRLDFIFRVIFLFIYATTLMVPLQTISAAPAPVAQESTTPEIELKQPMDSSSAAMGIKSAPNQSKTVDIENFTRESTMELAAKMRRLGYTLPSYPIYGESNGLSIEPVTAYNVVVDSNVLSPSSYGPSAATIGAKFCNTNDTEILEDVIAYTGNYDTNYDGTLGDATVGSFPRRFYDGVGGLTYYDETNFYDQYGDATPGTNILVGATATDYGVTTQPFTLKLESGSAATTSDGARYIGDLAPGECRTQYWLVSYPRKALIGGSWVDVTGGVKPEDDLWLPYFFWGTSTLSATTATSYHWNSLTMRNEISAMANKIWPNGDNKVPDQYVVAIQEQLGWDTWIPGDPTGSTAYPGETVTSQGIWYDLGVVGAGFDNDGDFVPDRNVWVQPIGDAGSYDPGCFRLVHTYGLLIIKLTDGTEQLIAFEDQMYFENIRDDNNGAVGLVFYEYIALDGACTAGLTPYQEVASGYDNEKFNADFGAGIPPLQSQETNITLDKTGPNTVGLTSGTMNYSMTFSFPEVKDSNNNTMTVTVGNPSYGTPLTFVDSVPLNVQYIANSASTTIDMSANYAPGDIPATLMHSKDGGATWLLGDPGNYTGTSASTQLLLQWRSTTSISSPPSGQTYTGTVGFQVLVPGTYTATTVTNEGCLTYGGGDGFTCDEHTTLVEGPYSISGNVFCDDGATVSASGTACDSGNAGGVSGSAYGENGSDEPGMNGIKVSLYLDANNNNAYDSGEALLASEDTVRYKVTDGYIDIDGDNNTTFPDTGDTLLKTAANGFEYSIINGMVDIDGDGLTGANDINGGDNGSFAGFTVIDGRLDMNRSGGTAADTSDDGYIAPYHFGKLPGSTNYVVVVDTLDAQIPTGYTNTTPAQRSADIAAANIRDVDFAFGPALTVVKRLDTPLTTVVGQTADVQYTLRFTNNIPGSGGASSNCTYRIYSSVVHDDSSDPIPVGGGNGAIWLNAMAAGLAPDQKYAYTDMDNNDNLIGFSGFNIGNMGGIITDVRMGAYVREKENTDGDKFVMSLYRNNTLYDGSPAPNYVVEFVGDYTTPASDYFNQSIGTVYEVETSVFTGLAWDWTSFQNNYTELQVTGNKAGGVAGDFELDAVYFEITTDQNCSDPGQIINPLPVTDTYEASYLSFVSANPPLDSGYPTVSGNDGTLYWSNIGPLYPGQTKEIVVTFHADAITQGVDEDNDADNTVTVNSAKFGNGRDVNTAQVNTPVIIVGSRSVSGVIWYETGTTNGWYGLTTSTGYTGADTYIPDAEVGLYVCQKIDGSYVTDTTTNKSCADQGGTWVLFDTQKTSSTGTYNFTGLYEGFYRVVVNTATLPTGANQTGDPNEPDTKINEYNICSTCDSMYGAVGTNLMSTDGVAKLIGATMSETNVNFGYDYTAGVYGNVRENLNGDRVTDSGEPVLSGVTVRLYNWTDDGDNIVETGEIGAQVGTGDITDANGNYFFGGLTNNAKYVLTIDTSALPTGSTWTITDENDPYIAAPYDDPISGSNEYNYIGFTAATDTNKGSFDFGLTRTGVKQIGNTLFYDWDNDSVQDSGVDEGIPNIDVKLYTDADGDGIVESGDMQVGSTISTLAYKVINGRLDMNRDGSITDADDGTYGGYAIRNGYVNIDGDTTETSDTDDDGTLLGYTVKDGYLDFDKDGTTNEAADSLEIGDYMFSALSSRNYVVVVNTADTDFPAGLSQSRDPDEIIAPATSGLCTVCDSKSHVSAAELAAEADNYWDLEDFGYYPFGPGSIGDTVWSDVNGDGVKSSVETGLSGVTVLLQVDMNGDGTYVTIDSTTTSSTGTYLFENLPVGTKYSYRVVVELSAANTAIIPNDMYGNEYTNSTGVKDITPTPDIVHISGITLTTAAPSYTNADFGFAPPASIGDTVYWDSNQNGTQDTGEPGVSGVPVRLFNFIDEYNGKYDTAETLTNDVNGNGSWDAGDTFIDRDGDGVWDYAETYTDNNSNGVWDRAELFTDLNKNGIYDSGEPFTDRDGDSTWDGAEPYTDSTRFGGDGRYQFGEYFFTDTNGNGIWDASEIRNTDPYAAGIVAVGTTTTAVDNALTPDVDETGTYNFNGLDTSVDGYPYVVVVDTRSGSPVYNHQLTGDPNLDGVVCPSSNAPAACDSRDGMVLYPGSSYMGADFGYMPSGAFGDTLWIDTNGNGMVDIGEKGISGVDVRLYSYTDQAGGTAGVYDPGIDTLGAQVGTTQTTDLNGNYFFTNVSDGNYALVVDAADLPAGLTNTYDPDGTANNVTSINIASGSVTRVGSCTASTGCTGEDNNDPLYLDADFGYKYIGSGAISGTICLEPTDDGICGAGTLDTNVTSGVDTNEVAYSDVTVYLYRWDDDGDNVLEGGETTQVASMQTTNGGDYSFANIPEGEYYIVAIGAPQSGLELTTTAGDLPQVGDNANEAVVESNPTGSDLSAYQIVSVPSSGDMSVENVDFAFMLSGVYDFGDLPISYSITKLEDTPDGARHEKPTGGYTVYLGAIAPDTESNGIPDSAAFTDDTIDTSGTSAGTDEDGVSVTNVTANESWNDTDGGTFGVTVTGSGYLVAWFDLNQDGDFNDANEMILDRAIDPSTDGNLNVPAISALPDGTYYARFRIFTTKPAVPSLAYAGAVVNGEVEDYKFLVNDGIPTPITLSYFLAQKDGSKINFQWSTATETSNLGFNLYVQTADQGLIRINNEVIRSNKADSLEKQDYTFSMEMSGEIFFIEDISVLGENHIHGPFQLGKAYGSDLQQEQNDLAAINAEHQAKIKERHDNLKQNMSALPAAALRSPSLTLQATSPGNLQLNNTLNLKVNKTGIYRVTYEMLREAGLNLTGVPTSKITLTNRGKIVPVYIYALSAARARKTFGAGDYIEFYGTALDTLYTDTNIYTLQVSKSAAPRMATSSNSIPRRVVFPQSFTETVTVNQQREYAYYAPGTDPWYDTSMLVETTPQSWNFPFQITDITNSSAAETLDLHVWGITDWPADIDHHLIASINGVPVADESFNGLVDKNITVEIPSGALREGENILTLTLPGDTGVDWDMINLDGFSVTYQRAFKAHEGQLTFSATGKAFSVTNLPNKNIIVYRQDSDGKISRIGKITVKTNADTTFTAAFAGSGKPATYYVLTPQAVLTPEFEPVRLVSNLDQHAQYLIISHPDFFDGLAPLVQAKQAQGLTVSVVDVYDLYAKYSYGIFDPQGIKDYIAYAKKNLGVEYVLLVGGDTYDYRNYLGVNSISFIPSLYANPNEMVKFVPVDPLYADINNDNVPDLPIGRFPVRTRAELDLMINKTLAYQTKDYGKTALFISDFNDGSISFKDTNRILAAKLPADWAVQKIDLDDVSVADAKTQMYNAMNSGTALITFTGHSAPIMWTFSGLLTIQNASFDNYGKPFIVTQWGCWNTYYVEPVNPHLVHKFLFSGENGAAAVLGASTQTDSKSEEQLGVLLTPKLAIPGKTIGMAVQEAKAELAASSDPEHLANLMDVILGWTLMGDPALVIQP